MKITFLGTGAADWKPERDRELAGYRRNASALIDDLLLIDPGACVPDALACFGKDAKKIRYVLNTHAHKDHYNAQTREMLESAGATFYKMAPGEVLTLGNYTVTALRANHAVGNDVAVHFLVSDGAHTVFYGLDGAWLTFEEAAVLKKGGVDLAVLDGTLGDQLGDVRVLEHNNLPMVEQLVAALKPYVPRFVISHMARTLHTPHDELVLRMAPHGVEVAFDGLELLLEN